MSRRPIVAVAIVAVSAWLVLGLVPAASATYHPTTVNGMTFYGDDANVAAGARLHSYAPGSTNVVIPSTVTIGADTFNVTQIDISAFENKGITSVVLPNTLVTIQDNAFEGNLLTSISLPASLTTIGNNAFQNNAITSLVIPDTLTSLGADAFLTNHLTSLTIGTGLNQIPLGAFQQNLLTSVVFPANITSIGFQAFATNHLASIDFQGPVTSIGQSAFAQNDLGSVTFPPTVTTIGPSAFYDNLSLNPFTFTGAAPTSITPPGGNNGSLETGAPVTVDYLWAHDAAQAQGGFTSPTWQGYSTQELVTRTFDLNGHGAAIDPQLIPDGHAPAAPPAPVSPQLTFKGWYTDAALTTRANFAAPLTADQTLFARWDPILAATGGTINYDALWAGLTAAVVGGAFLMWSRRRRLTS